LLLVAPLYSQSGGRHSQSVTELSADAVFRKSSGTVYLIEAVNAHGDVLLRQNGVAVKAHALASTKNILESAADLGVGHGMQSDERIAKYVIRQGFKTWNVTNVLVDIQHDLSIFECPDLDAQLPQRRNSASLSVGEKVFAVGISKGQDETLAAGLITGLQANGGAKIISASISLSEESAGSGLFDTHGRLVGILTYDSMQSPNSALPVEWTLNPSVPFSITPKQGAEPPKTNQLFNDATVWSYNFQKFSEMALIQKNVAYDEVRRKIYLPDQENAVLVRLQDATLPGAIDKTLPENVDNWPLWRQANAYMETIRFDLENASRVGVDDDGVVSATAKDGRKLWSDIADLYCRELPGASFMDLEGKVRACAPTP
jgi:hypothetical protein